MSDLTREQVAEIVGPVGVDEFDTAPDYAKAELTEWVRVLRDLSDDALGAESRHWIYESALVGGSRRNFNHIHCKATACYHESRRRQMAAGHEKYCHGPSIYNRAYAAVLRGEGHTPPAEGTCACDMSAVTS